tara:strand:- start:88 stop:618 length:531 start_codon:yes stop_codon:yes gene_type:complete
MGLLTTIDEIPLYSTVQEAIEWADRNGLNGAHVHKWKNEGYSILGYMGGASHAEAVSGGEDNPHPCKDPLWLNLPLGTPSNLQKIDYCNRCAAMPGTSGNPLLGNFPVNIISGFWSHWQGGVNYCSCCYGVIQTEIEPIIPISITGEEDSGGETGDGALPFDAGDTSDGRGGGGGY